MSDDQKPPLTFEDVQEILRILEKSTFDELHLDIGNLRLTLRRGGGVQSPVPAWENAEPATTPINQTVATHPRPAKAAATEAGLIEIRAPMLGTFYRAPRPGAAPFVDIGTKVEPNTTIGIIEVMKLMNAGPAGAEGEVREICVQNGPTVEYDEVLVLISPR